MNTANLELETSTAETAANPNRWYVFACLMILSLALTSSIESSAERAFATNDVLSPWDFQVFYLGGKVVLQRGATPLYYPPAKGEGYTLLYKYASDTSPWGKLALANGFPKALQYTNPPFSAVFMVPFATVPWQWGYLLWQAFAIILTAATIFLTLQIVLSGSVIAAFALIFAAAYFFFPLRNNLICGQVNVTILFVWALGVYLLHRQKPVASGVCFALGTALKVSPIVAVPFLILRRQWQWLAGYVAGVGAFTGISVWALGWRTNLTWLMGIYPSISSGVGSISNRSLAGLINVLVGPSYFATFYTDTEWAVPHGLALFEKVCSLAIGSGFIFWCWRKRKDARGLVNELVLLPLVYVLAAPFSWSYHYVLAVLPLTYLWAKAREATTGELVALYFGTLAVGTELPMYLAAYSPWASSHLIVVAIALWPAATCVLLWVGMRMYIRSQALEQSIGTAV